MVSSTLLRLKREGGISQETLPRKRSSSRIERRISCLFSSCCGKIGVHLELNQGSQRPTRGASGKSSLHASCKGPLRIPFQLVPGPRSSSGAQSGSSGVLSSADMAFGVPMEFPQESQASSHVET